MSIGLDVGGDGDRLDDLDSFSSSPAMDDPDVLSTSGGDRVAASGDTDRWGSCDAALSGDLVLLTLLLSGGDGDRDRPRFTGDGDRLRFRPRGSLLPFIGTTGTLLKNKNIK